MVNWDMLGIKLTGLASNGYEAIELASAEPPDILLTDIRMPRMTGLQLIQQLHVHGCDPVSIILSGYSDFDFAKQSIRLGVFDYLVKPCRPSEIQRAVVAARDKVRERTQPARPDESWRSGQDTAAEREPPRTLVLNLPVVAGARPPVHRTVRRVVEIIETEFSTNLTLESVAGRVYVSAAYLSALFKQETGVNFLDYLHCYRIEQAKALLIDGSMKIHAIARAVGYFDEPHFHRTFKKWTGLTPSQYQQQQGQT